MRITWLLLAACIAVYLAGSHPTLWLWPLHSPHYRWWQPLTYGLVHGGPLHLALNMLALASFGPSLEREWGRGRFLAVYALCAAVGGVVQAWAAHAPVVGASASLFGLFAAYTVANPRKRIISLLPLPLPAWLVLAAYLGLTIAAWVFGWMPGIAHEAHLGGASMGLMCATYLRGAGSRR